MAILVCKIRSLINLKSYRNCKNCQISHTTIKTRAILENTIMTVPYKSLVYVVIEKLLTKKIIVNSNPT